MKKLTAQAKLDALYIKIADGLPMADEIMARINQLEEIVNPTPRCEFVSTEEPKGCGCSDPAHCWECAAIRGGCPEDV